MTPTTDPQPWEPQHEAIAALIRDLSPDPDRYPGAYSLDILRAADHALSLGDWDWVTNLVCSLPHFDFGNCSASVIEGFITRYDRLLF